MNLAFIVFGIFNWLLSLVCLIVILRWQISRVSPLAFFYLLGCTLVLCFNAVQFGQASIIQLAAAVVIISALHVNRPFVAGLAIPLVIIKPHLVIYFLFAALKRGGRRMLLAGIGAILVLMFLALLMQPSWITDMLRVIIYGQLSSPMEWNKYVTLAGLFSLPPCIGIMVWLLLLRFLILLDSRFRSVPSNIWLPITLVLSLATAPYAFAYDLILLLPAVVWLCLPMSPLSIVIISIVLGIVISAGFSGVAYLAVLSIALYSIRGAILQTRSQFIESRPF